MDGVADFNALHSCALVIANFLFCAKQVLF